MWPLPYVTGSRSKSARALAPSLAANIAMVNSMSTYLTGFLTKVWPGARHVLDYLVDCFRFLKLSTTSAFVYDARGKLAVALCID